jgi:opacity protein-like surface antigen
VASPARASGDGVPDKGFYLGLGLGASSTNPPLAVPSLTAGYRLINRLEIHLALQFAANSVTGTNGAGATEHGTAGFFTVAPGLSIDIVRFLNDKVALYADAGIPIGLAFATIATSNGGGSGSAFAIGFDAGLGVRYALAQMFTIGLEGGVLGLFAIGANTAGGFGSSSLVGFYGAIVANLYFGK